MTSADLGYDAWFASRFDEHAIEGVVAARVTAVHRDSYIVRNAASDFPAELTGRLRFSAETAVDLPCVGDWVVVQPENESTFGIIHALLERKSFLRRKAAGRHVEYQMIAANVDKALIIQSCDYDFNVRRLERYVVMAYEGSIQPVVLLSKTDLVDEDQLEERIAAVKRIDASHVIIPFSNETDQGLEQVTSILRPKSTYCLLGSSGVGKTTLINRLVGHEKFETVAVREKDGRGRHATSHRHLVMLDSGAMLIDTPGMRELANIGAATGIEEGFSQIIELAAECKFSDCTHTTEVDCAVIAAVEEGILDMARYENYLKLARESAHYEMSYVERRKRDRAFGKYVRSVVKENRKRRDER
jgi:ribosome biogenesis GTPase